MPVLIRLNKRERPGNLPSASRVPSGKPINRLMPVAMPEICRERVVIWRISEMNEVSINGAGE
jgi:hypothetical protein